MIDPATERSVAVPASGDVVPIAVAVVLHEGRVLVGTRGQGGPLAGYAEFPGGKCQPGESPAACAVRECREESGLDVEVVGLLDERSWDYPHGRVQLHFFHCRLLAPPPASRPSTAASAAIPASAAAAPVSGSFAWRELAALRALQFPEANHRAIELLLAEAQRLSETAIRQASSRSQESP